MITAIVAACAVAAVLAVMRARRARVLHDQDAATGSGGAPGGRAVDASHVALADLPDDAAAEVVAVDAACQGFSRRRLLDLGFTEGAVVEPGLRTFAGDPRAYRVRGTVVALRRDQARHVIVRPIAGGPRQLA